MSNLLNFITTYHKSTKRDFFGRMKDEKVKCMKIAKKFDKDFWDGERRYGYGGFKYIEGLLEPLANSLVKYYNLKSNSKVLDVGCGKGFLLYEISKILPGIKISGFDISKRCCDRLDLHLSIRRQRQMCIRDRLHLKT